jgi:hypothetical protein
MEEDPLSHSNASGAKWAGHERSPIPVTEKGVALLSDLHCFSDVSELSFLFFMSVVMHGCFYFGDRLRVLFSIESGDTTFDLRVPPITPSGSFMLGGSVCVHLLILVSLSSSVCRPLRCLSPLLSCVHGAVLVPDMISFFLRSRYCFIFKEQRHSLICGYVPLCTE